MFAVIKTGGKQYRVAANDILTIERLAADTGALVQFNDVLMIGGDTPVVGAPMVADAAVQAEIIEQKRGPKVISFHKRRRKHSSQRKRGHRQYLTVIKVTDILASGAGATGVQAAVGGLLAGSDEAAAVAAAPAGARPGNLLQAARNGSADDLKKLTGVGPKMATLLNEHGVFHYDQIAAWTPAEADHMDEQMGLKGRIARDNWIEQAAALATVEE